MGWKFINSPESVALELTEFCNSTEKIVKWHRMRNLSKVAIKKPIQKGYLNKKAQ